MVDETRKSSRALVTFLIVLVLIFAVVIPGYYYLQSESGKRLVSNTGTFLSTQMDRLSGVYLGFLEEQERGLRWETEEPGKEEKQGVVFKEFRLIGSNIVSAGDPLQYQYVLEVNNVEEEVDLKLECQPPEGVVDGEVKVSEAKGVSSLLPVSYSNLICEFKTKEGMEATAITNGALSFIYKTKTRLKVYFITEDLFNELPKRKDFFEYYNIKIDRPIRSSYNNEPVGIALVAADNAEQPIIVSERFRPMVGMRLEDKWGEGRISEISDLVIYLPEGVALKDQPTKLCPLEKKDGADRRGIKYGLVPELAEKIRPRGEETTIEFRCNVDIDDAIADDPTSPQHYYAETEYTYTYNPKPAKAVSIGVEEK